MILSESLESHHFWGKCLHLEMLQLKVEKKEPSKLELTRQTPF